MSTFECGQFCRLPNFLIHVLQSSQLEIIDTYTEEDRSFAEVLVAQGFAEYIASDESEVNNAPATSNDDSLYEEVEEIEEDDCKYNKALWETKSLFRISNLGPLVF